MRAIRNLKDVEVVLRDILNFQDRIESQPLNMKLRQIKTLGNGIDPQDAVTLKQLHEVRDQILKLLQEK